MNWLKEKAAAAREAAHTFKMNYSLMGWGVACLLVATVGETTWFKPIIEELPHAWHGPFELCFGLAKELGFALLIAWGISNFIDRKARQRDEEAATETRGRIARDVIHAVFGLQHDAEYVRKVVEHALEPKVIRDRIDSEYTIEELTNSEVTTLDVEPGRFIKLTMVSTYTFRNVSSRDVDHVVKYGLAVRSGPKLREFARVVSGCIGGTDLTASELVHRPDDDGGGDDGKGYKTYEWMRKIPAKGCLDVVIEAVSVKERSDNEVWASYFATVKSSDFKARVRIPNMIFDVRALTATTPTKLRKTHSGGDWKIEGPILPNESLVFWWRSREDDGLAPAGEIGGPPQESS